MRPNLGTLLLPLLGSSNISVGSSNLFTEGRFYDDNMCGVANLDITKPEPPTEFSCPYQEPEVYRSDEDWPWLGIVTNTDTKDTFLGVVIAEDTIVTDVMAKNNINGPSSLKFGILDSVHIMGESSFTRSEVFSSDVASIKSEATTLFLVLKNKIPKELFRPICIPPARYLEKMVKPTSCQGEKTQTITKVDLENNGFMKTTEDLFDEHSCSLSFLKSPQCIEHYKTKFGENDALKQRKFFDDKAFPEYKPMEPENITDYYTCHVGAITAAQECNLGEAEVEATCRNVKNDQCLGFITSGQSKDDEQLDESQKQNRKCAEKTSEEYTECAVRKFEEAMHEKSDRPYKGINCLHDYMQVSPCAKKDGQPGLMPLGRDWVFDPCSVQRLNLQKHCTKKGYKNCFDRQGLKSSKYYKKLNKILNKCENIPKNRYFKVSKPFKKFWSLSMLNNLQKFSDSVIEESQCNQCAEGPNICTKPHQKSISDSKKQSFLFWFDSCRDKWFFVGTQKPSSLDINLPRDCEQPTVYSNMEAVTKLMREEVGGKVPKIYLYPKPVIVLLGPTGVGKSTTGNSLLKGNAKNGVCFQSGSGTSSKTKVTAWSVGKWLGVGQCFTVVDTPGTDDTSGEHQDYENIKELTEFLKTDLMQIDVFLVMFKETNSRFVSSMSKAIGVFESIFGDTFYKNMAVEFTFWNFDEGAMKERYRKLCNEDLRGKDCPVYGSEEEEDGSGDDYDYGLDEDEPENQQDQEDLICKLMMAKHDANYNEMFFSEQNISSTGWKNLEPQNNLYQEEFIQNQCQEENVKKFTSSMYEKADLTSRMIKKYKWNKNFDSSADIPYVFIHPVWDTEDEHQCIVFKRETSKLLRIANKMDPFKCSAKCKAPTSFFNGQPMILDHMDKNDTVHADFERKSFQLSCTIWNGVSYGGLRDEDVSWFQGWTEIYRYTQKKESSHIDNLSFAKLEINDLSKKDQGLYDCTYPGVKEIATLTFSAAAKVENKDIQKGSVEISCRIPLDVDDVDINKVSWYFASKIMKTMKHFSTSLNKVTNQFAVSQLYMVFEQNYAREFEGVYGCKTDEFSNQVHVLINENAKWSTWSQWSSCSKTCQAIGEDHGTKKRSRKCMPHRNNGKPCKDIEGRAEEIEPCNIKCCPKDGRWSPWSGWEACKQKNSDKLLKTCSKEGEPPGQMSRSRVCYSPSCGGSTCIGDPKEVKDCNSFAESPCPIDGAWGSWGGWSDCIKGQGDTCAGLETRTRNCDSPRPQHGGHVCPGTNKEERFCEPVCPIDCKCGEFTNWGQCPKTCGECGKDVCEDGLQYRERHCTKEQNGGQSCTALYGQLTEKRICVIPHCPIDGYPLPWSAWSDCDHNTGLQERTRSCEKPRYQGKECNVVKKEVQKCDVDCNCDGVSWGEWSSCTGTCGDGERNKNRVCKSHINNGRQCKGNDADEKFSTKVTEKCSNKRRCPLVISGKWEQWGDWSTCSVKCGGGTQSRSRKCGYPGKTTQKEGQEPFDEDYDRVVPCSGSGVEILGLTEADKCNKKSCEVSTLFFLMDTTGSFSGVDQNSALTLGTDLLKELKREKVNVPEFRIVTINDPKTEVKKEITNQNIFETKLRGIYKEKRPGGNNNWEEKSMDGILKAVNVANHGAVICLFTDAASHDLNLEADIVKKIREKDVHIFIFLTPDYPLYPGEGDSYRKPKKGMESYRVYQRISHRHTYIMKKTEPSTAAIVMQKALKTSQKECVTYTGPAKWVDAPNECQFPFWYNGEEHKKCITEGKTQPWCATIVKQDKDGKYVPSKKGGENWWGYCGNCKGEVDKRCKAGGHTVLKDTWRVLKDKITSGRKLYDDSSLTRGWYKFDVPGSTNTLPTFTPGLELTKYCQIGGNYARVELPSSGTLVEHDEDSKRIRFCFDADCNQFKMIEVLWCPPDVPTKQPFYIYELKPTEKDMAYCV